MLLIVSEEFERLKRIEQLAKQAVNYSSAFVSCWEFDSYQFDVNPEAVHKELKELIKGTL